LKTPHPFSLHGQVLRLGCALLVLAAPLALKCHAQTAAPTPVVNVISTPLPAPQTSAATRQGAPASGLRKATRVVTGAITGRVVGEGGESLPGVQVFAFTRAFNPVPRMPRAVTTDEEGAFRLDGLEPGVYSLSANLPGYVVEADPQTGRGGGAYRLGDTATVRLVKGGVITGTVSDAQGEPLAELSVRAYRVRDLDGRPVSPGFALVGEDKTDDRGIYRIYSLQPGVYIVLAGGLSPWSFGIGSAYDIDAPTFYPSATRDTATEVSVRTGQETAGIDIRYREEQGHRVTGKIEGAPAAQGEEATVGVYLSYAASGVVAGSNGVSLTMTERSFSLEGIADGDYDLQASVQWREGTTAAAPPQRVSVRGADVTGLKLTLAPLASVSGTLVVEQATEAERARDACKERRASLLPQETLVNARRDDPPPARGLPVISRTSPSRDAAPAENGAFTLRSLEAGRYRLAARPVDEGLYVRSVQLPGATATPAAPSNSAPPRGGPATASAAARDVLDIRAGQQLSGVTVRVAEGAAGFAGRVVPTEGGTLPPFASLRVYLLPAERERADDTLRFFEATPTGDGAFAFKNLAPGRYLVIARTVGETAEAATRPPFWDADSRAKLRHEAEASNLTVELQPCGRVADFTLRFPPK
jgi:hypothetical protein